MQQARWRARWQCWDRSALGPRTLPAPAWCCNAFSLTVRSPPVPLSSLPTCPADRLWPLESPECKNITRMCEHPAVRSLMPDICHVPGEGCLWVLEAEAPLLAAAPGPCLGPPACHRRPCRCRPCPAAAHSVHHLHACRATPRSDAPPPPPRPPHAALCCCREDVPAPRLPHRHLEQVWPPRVHLLRAGR